MLAVQLTCQNTVSYNLSFAVHCTKTYTVKRAPEDGRICRPKHVGLN